MKNISAFTSFILLIALSPAILLIAILIYLDDGFPLIFKQKRVGINNRIFWIYKFRTMKLGTPNVATDLLNSGNEVYTKSGPVLRKFSLDELPQLVNIFKGDILFIGPRPALYNQHELIELRTEKKIHMLMPGLTGWAQVNGRDNLSVKEKVELDNYYLKNKSIMLDFKILGLTILKVLKAEHVTI